MIRCATRRGRFAHYTRDGVLTLCNFSVMTWERISKHRRQRLVESAVCNRCNKAAGPEGVL